MSKFSPYISMASILLLSACGSGGSSSDKDDNTPPATYNFTLTSVLKNNCGVESAYTDVELVLQDEAWQTISTHKADENGTIELTTQNTEINYTLIARTKQKNTDEGIEAVSYYKVSANSSVKYYADFDTKIDDSSCECSGPNDIVLNHNRLDELNVAHSSALFAGYEPVDANNTKFIGVEVCKGINEEWPLHSFSVEGRSGNYPLVGYAGFGNGYENLSDSSLAFEYTDLSNKNPELNFSQLFNGLSHFETNVAEDYGSILVFDNHDYSDITIYRGYAKFEFEETSSGPLTRTTLNSEHETHYGNNNYTDALDLNPSNSKPNIDLEYLSEISDSGEYDFSAVSNYHMTIITFDYLAKDPATKLDMPVKWTIYGPIEGLLPTTNGLPGYEDIISPDTSIKGTFVKLVRSSNSDDYEDYIRHYTTSSGSANLENSRFAEDLQFYNINLELK